MIDEFGEYSDDFSWIKTKNYEYNKDILNKGRIVKELERGKIPTTLLGTNVIGRAIDIIRYYIKNWNKL